MADTARALSVLQTLLADNSEKNVSPQDLRDFLVSTELRQLVTKTANYTADADDQTILLDGTSSTVAITLPTAAGITGKRYTLKCINLDNACSIATDGGETIDGAASYSFTTVQDCIEIVSDDTNWQIINEYLNA